MRIRDLTIEDIRRGQNWKVLSADEFDWGNDLLENLQIIEASNFDPGDLVVYSAIFVTDVGEVIPLVVIKEVQDLDYWGDSCEFVHGRWHKRVLWQIRTHLLGLNMSPILSNKMIRLFPTTIIAPTIAKAFGSMRTSSRFANDAICRILTG